MKQYLLNILFMTPKTNCVEAYFTYKKMSPLKSTLHWVLISMYTCTRTIQAEGHFHHRSFLIPTFRQSRSLPSALATIELLTLQLSFSPIKISCKGNSIPFYVMVGRIKASQRCPDSNPWNLKIFYLHGKDGFFVEVIKLRVLRCGVSVSWIIQVDPIEPLQSLKPAMKDDYWRMVRDAV